MKSYIWIGGVRCLNSEVPNIIPQSQLHVVSSLRSPYATHLGIPDSDVTVCDSTALCGKEDETAFHLNKVIAVANIIISLWCVWALLLEPKPLWQNYVSGSYSCFSLVPYMIDFNKVK